MSVGVYGTDGLAAAARLHGLVATAYGPLPGEKLVLTATRKAVLTSCGATVLAHTPSDAPEEELVHKAASALAAAVGDGSKAFVMMLDAALAEARRQLEELPVERQHAHRAKLARAAGWLSQQALVDVVAPCWRAQAVRTATSDEFAIRTHASMIISTALGRHLGSTASSALAAALLEAIFPLHDLSTSAQDPRHSNGMMERARQRTQRDEAGGILVLSAGGAQPDRSRATEGRLVRGRPGSEAMPTALLDGGGCALLLLGEHAASPEVATTSEAKRAGVAATVDSVVSETRGGGGSVLHLSDVVDAERVAWAQALRKAGVRLVLSGAPLGAATCELCAAHGVCAVGGVEKDDLRAISLASGRSPVQAWPRASHLEGLLQPSAGFVARGCTFEACSLGGTAYVRVCLAHAPQLATLIARAPSEALAKEYGAAVSRVLACLRLWLEPSDAGGAGEDGSSSELLSLPGAGAAELQLEACVRRFARANSRPAPLRPEELAALEILRSALLAVPHRLHANGARARALPADEARWPSTLLALRAAHDRAATCAMGVVFSTTTTTTTTQQGSGFGDSGGGGGGGASIGLLQELSDAACAGLLEPFALKMRLLDSVICCLSQLLSLDGRRAVAVRRLPLAQHRAHGGRRVGRPRHRVDGCSSEESSSSDSGDDEQGRALSENGSATEYYVS